MNLAESMRELAQKRRAEITTARAVRNKLYTDHAKKVLPDVLQDALSITQEAAQGGRFVCGYVLPMTLNASTPEDRYDYLDCLAELLYVALVEHGFGVVKHFENWPDTPAMVDITWEP